MLGKCGFGARGRTALFLLAPVLVAACAGSGTQAGPAASPASRQDSLSIAKDATALARAQKGRGEFDLADRTLHIALERAKASGDRAALAEVEAGQTWLLADRAFYESIDVDAAAKIIEEAMKVARESGNRAALATTIDGAAFFEYRDILFNGGSYTQVRGKFEEALSLYEALGDLSGQAIALFHIGLTYQQDGKNAESRPYFLRSASAAERADDPATLSFPVRHLGYLFAAEGNLDEALRYQRRCLFLRIRGGLTLNVPYAYIAVGEAEFAKGEFVRARVYYNDALEMGREQHSDGATLDAHMSLGKVDERENHKDIALRHYLEAITLAEKLKRNTDVKEACDNLVRVYEQLGDRDKAKFYRQRSREADQALKSKG